jgi:anti-anti-sigma factor
MDRRHHSTVVPAGTLISTRLIGALVPERLRGPGHDLWIGWTVADDVVVIAVAGDICTASAGPLVARLDELVRQFCARAVALDLSRVGFADARVATMLVRLGETCRDCGADLDVTATSQAVERVLRICGWTADSDVPAASAGDARHRDGELVAVRRGIDPVRN